ncbi:MAG: hypothetical protein JSR41_07185 [Proteobacteria bacterium]|nr:hypothetical protein [Pseudomonadota bacterium]
MAIRIHAAMGSFFMEIPLSVVDGFEARVTPWRQNRAAHAAASQEGSSRAVGTRGGAWRGSPMVDASCMPVKGAAHADPACGHARDA